MQTLEAVAMCPNCASMRLVWNPLSVSCPDCRSEFRRAGEFVDFVNDGPLGELEARALDTWGNDLHAAALAAPAHFTQVRDIFPDAWRRALKGTVLEIGCGSGTDILQLGRLNDAVSLFGFDIGANVAGLSMEFKGQKNVHLFRANALRIPVRNEIADMIYSFGVIHHTRDPEKCFREAHRVLKKDGAMFFYLYSAHEDNPVKFAGVLLEKALMGMVTALPRFLRPTVLFAVSLPCLLVFSWPAQLLRLAGLARLAGKFPMHWGTTPGSILPDLKDRLLAPVNHRFRQKDLRSLLAGAGFREVRIEKNSAGLYGYCVK